MEKSASFIVYNIYMRRARFTFKGAFHHVMNRGYNGSVIFPQDIDKKYFLAILNKKAHLLKIRILAYCIMNNHYHIILQNTSGKLSDFMKQVNSIYATYYRKKYGGEGYVFQNRFKSTLIQQDKYLINAIIYTLLNPVRAKIAGTIFEYRWSSANEYFGKVGASITDRRFVEEIIQSKGNLMMLCMKDVKIEDRVTRVGKVMGDDRFVEESMKMYERRNVDMNEKERRRIGDWSHKRLEQVIEEFETGEGIRISDIDVYRVSGKRLRLKLLIKIREESGLRFSEINKIKIFQDLKLNSLSVLYNRAIIRKYGERFVI